MSRQRGGGVRVQPFAAVGGGGGRDTDRSRDAHEEVGGSGDTGTRPFDGKQADGQANGFGRAGPDNGRT